MKAEKIIFKVIKVDRLTKKEVVLTKHRRIVSKCPHKHAPYYAKGMCRNCYHSKGRNKKATKCGHEARAMYAKGICRACYLRRYHKSKKEDERS